MSFLGSCLIGLGFTMEPERARQLIAADQRNAEVLFPYLNGKDLNSSSDCAASRWVVDFKEMPESEARTWGEVWSWIEERVKPERMTKDAKAYPRMVHEWWKY